MNEEKRRTIASQGGKAAHAKGTGHEFTSTEAREAGRRGGMAVSQDREHMAEIGRKGGKQSAKKLARHVIRELVVLCIAMLGVISSGQLARAEEGTQKTPATSPALPAMAEQEMKTFLGRPLIAHLATVRANGTPQLVPMWFFYEGGVMYMSTRTQAAKVQHLRTNPRVAVVVDVMEAPLKNKVVTLEGTVEVQTTGVKEMTTRIYQKYMGTEGAATPVAQRNINTPRVILKITPKRVQSIDTTR